jgi:hypothetical protein
MVNRSRCCRIVRFCLLLVVAGELVAGVPCRAATEEVIIDTLAIAQLEQRALHADPREQCYLYAQVVHSMAEAAGRDMLNGDSDEALAMLKRADHYAELLQKALARDTKRMKDAEKLMEHTTERLNESMRRTSGDDRLAMQATLKRLDHVHDQLLDQVFSH